MPVGKNLTLKAGVIGCPLIEKFIDIMRVKHFVVFLELVDFDAGILTDVAAVALLIEVGLPFAEVVLGCSNLEVLLCRRFVHHLLVLRRLHQSRSVPGGETRHPVQGTQLQVGIDIADVDLASPAHLDWIGARRLRHRVGFFEPVA